MKLTILIFLFTFIIIKASEIKIGQYNFYKKNSDITVPPLILGNHSALFINYKIIKNNNEFSDSKNRLKEQNKEIALGMLRDVYGVQL